MPVLLLLGTTPILALVSVFIYRKVSNPIQIARGDQRDWSKTNKQKGKTSKAFKGLFSYSVHLK